MEYVTVVIIHGWWWSNTVWYVQRRNEPMLLHFLIKLIGWRCYFCTFSSCCTHSDDTTSDSGGYTTTDMSKYHMDFHCSYYLPVVCFRSFFFVDEIAICSWSSLQLLPLQFAICNGWQTEKVDYEYRYEWTGVPVSLPDSGTRDRSQIDLTRISLKYGAAATSNEEWSNAIK